MSLQGCSSFQAQLRLMAIVGALIASSWSTVMAHQQSTDPSELEALFEVMTGINSETEWKLRLPDPCMGGQQGIYCLPDDVTGTYHVTNLEFGSVSEYEVLIPCSDHSFLHPSIGKLPFLQTLFIFNCFVNGSATIPKELGRLHNSLQMLTLQGNSKLEGSLPKELGNLTSLQRLVLRENSLGGVVPEELGRLSDLLQLDLSENRLQGAIPVSLSSLKSLVILDLGGNLLSGALPSLGGLVSLRKLVFSNNNLSGHIPEDIGNIAPLTYLDLSSNSLSGGIPSSFQKLKNLEDLFLEKNCMRSPLPDFLGAIVGLSRLSLSESGYVGEIPYSFGKLVNLRVLLLRGNALSGHIPMAIGSLPHLYQLDLSVNHLTGPVPFSPDFVKKMGVNLRMRNNSGLCIPHRSQQFSLAAMGVGVCDDAHNSENVGGRAHSPSYPASEDAPIYTSNVSMQARIGMFSCLACMILCGFVIIVPIVDEIIDLRNFDVGGVAGSSQNPRRGNDEYKVEHEAFRIALYDYFSVYHERCGAALDKVAVM